MAEHARQRSRTMKKTQIAVLITCHNRCDATLGCLRRLYEQAIGESFEIDVFVVDAGSTDGTREAIRRGFPRVKLIPRDDTVFWCGGMLIAWKAAVQGRYEYFIWLNDDVALDRGAVKTLLKTAEQGRSASGRTPIVVGAMRDPQTGATTYGGLTRGKGIRCMSFSLVEPREHPLSCSTMHGNLVLVPASAVEKIGLLSDAFTHGLGDLDYGLRATRNGIACQVAPGHLGTCARNAIAGSHYDSNLSARERIRKMNAPTGLPPAREWMRFTRRHARAIWPLFWARTIVRACCPRLWVALRRRRAWDAESAVMHAK